MLAKIDTIDLAIRATLLTVAERSQRVYDVTYRHWIDWCHNNRIDPLELHPQNVIQFLTDQHVTRATRQRQLSAMRALLRLLAIAPDAPQMKVYYDLLKLAKVPKENLSDSERNRRALSPDDVQRILETWEGDNPISVRNRALVAFLLATGVRRSEAVEMCWRDIDLIDGIAVIRHGKGDEERTIAIVGDYAIDHLETWKAVQGDDRHYVFCPLDNRGRLQGDKAMSADNLYRIIKKTEKLSGVSLSPHDTRRTLATELLTQGATLADVQNQLGHAQSSTTLRYFYAADARERRKRFKTRYGD